MLDVKAHKLLNFTNLGVQLSYNQGVKMKSILLTLVMAASVNAFATAQVELGKYRAIDSDTKTVIATFEGLSQDLALKPGTYLAAAHVNGEVLTAKFKIVAGEQRDIMLGN